MIIKNNTAYHVAIPGTSYSIRPYRTITVPEGKYELVEGLEIVGEKKKIFKKVNE